MQKYVCIIQCWMKYETKVYFYRIHGWFELNSFLQLLMDTKIRKNEAKVECVKQKSNLFRNHLVKLWLVIRYYKYIFQPKNLNSNFPLLFMVAHQSNWLHRQYISRSSKFLEHYGKSFTLKLFKLAVSEALI